MRLLLLAICGVGLVQSQEDPAGLARLIKPQPGESKWAEISWLTNLKDARERAVREDKSLFLWRAGGGDTLGRT